VLRAPGSPKNVRARIEARVAAAEAAAAAAAAAVVGGDNIGPAPGSPMQPAVTVLPGTVDGSGSNEQQQPLSPHHPHPHAIVRKSLTARGSTTRLARSMSGGTGLPGAAGAAGSAGGAGQELGSLVRAPSLGSSQQQHGAEDESLSSVGRIVKPGSASRVRIQQQQQLLVAAAAGPSAQAAAGDSDTGASQVSRARPSVSSTSSSFAGPCLAVVRWPRPARWAAALVAPF
jgi:hypothetical protein